MVTKYNTGDIVLVPATIRSARQENDQIFYDVETSWTIPEDQVKPGDDMILLEAVKNLNFERW